MGSLDPKETPPNSARKGAAPDTLARLVLRCRELSNALDQDLPRLPTREETPFLYGQLDDVLQRLQANLRQLSGADTTASEKGAGFLRRLAGKKTREQPRKSEPRYDLQGNAWTIPVTELVGFLSHSGKSGLLWVTSPTETFVLEFARGNLVHATSNAPPVAFRLGEILLAQGLLSAADLAEVIDFAKAADDLLGSYLLRTGRLQHSDLQRALAVQVQQLFHRLMDAENALYRFQEGAQLLRSQSLEVNITQLLLESARKKDEERQEADRHAPPALDLGALEAATLESATPAPLPEAVASLATSAGSAASEDRASAPSDALEAPAPKAEPSAPLPSSGPGTDTEKPASLPNSGSAAPTL
ncbi:MAG: DUF4388 domain-containing protein [Planctomycetes bacterium]|nr:DUF4388 domain-containing protein [Planctomycetota bacterium]